MERTKTRGTLSSCKARSNFLNSMSMFLFADTRRGKQTRRNRYPDNTGLAVSQKSERLRAVSRLEHRGEITEQESRPAVSAIQNIFMAARYQSLQRCARFGKLAAVTLLWQRLGHGCNVDSISSSARHKPADYRCRPIRGNACLI